MWVPEYLARQDHGDAREDSGVDLLVDLLSGSGNALLRAAGIFEERSILLGAQVDVVAADLFRHEVSATALADVLPE